MLILIFYLQILSFQDIKAVLPCSKICNYTIEFETIASKDNKEDKQFYRELDVILPTDNIHTVLVSAVPNSYLCNKFFKLNYSIDILAIASESIEEIEEGFLEDNVLVDDLYINNSTISKIRRHSFVNLSVVRLDLSNNQIDTIENQAFVNLTNLRALLLSDNKLKAINADGILEVPDLVYFVAEKNVIQHLSSCNFKFITAKRPLIALGRNQISYIDPKLFYDCDFPQHFILLLDHNDISYIDSELLNGKSPVELDLSCNRIEHVYFVFCRRCNIKTLNILNNPLSEESVNDLIEFMRTRRGILKLYSGANSNQLTLLLIQYFTILVLISKFNVA